MANEIYNSSDWGLPIKYGWGDIYYDFYPCYRKQTFISVNLCFIVKYIFFREASLEKMLNDRTKYFMPR